MPQGRGLLLSNANVPCVKNSRLIAVSRRLISRQTSSTFFSSLTSDLIKTNSPSGLTFLQSVMMRSAASWTRPMMYTRGLRASLAKARR